MQDRHLARSVASHLNRLRFFLPCRAHQLKNLPTIRRENAIHLQSRTRLHALVRSAHLRLSSWPSRCVCARSRGRRC